MEEGLRSVAGHLLAAMAGNLSSHASLNKVAQSAQELGDQLYKNWQAALNRNRVGSYLGHWADKNAQNAVSGVGYPLVSDAVNKFTAIAVRIVANYLTDRRTKMEDSDGDLIDDLYSVFGEAWQAAKMAATPKASKQKHTQSKYNKESENKVSSWLVQVQKIIPVLSQYIVNNPKAADKSRIEKYNTSYLAVEKNLQSLLKSKSYHINKLAQAVNPLFDGKASGKDIRYIDALMKREISMFQSWARSKGFKLASFVYNIKQAGGFSSGKQTPAGSRGGARGGNSVVREIQEKLDEVAKVLEQQGGEAEQINTLRNTGPRNNPTFNDGAYGSATKKALELAEKMRRFLSEKGKKSKDGTLSLGKYTDLKPITNTPDRSNITNLETLKQALIKEKGSGSGAKQGTVLSNIGDIPLTTNDVRSPLNFYVWLVNKASVQAFYTPDGEEHVKIKEFDQYIQSLILDAQGKMSTTDKKTRSLGAQYARAVTALKRQWENIVNMAARDYGVSVEHLRAVNAVHKSFLYRAQRGKSRRAPGGLGAKQDRKRGRSKDKKDYGGRSRAIFGNKYSKYSTSDLPISDIIDLRDPRWKARHVPLILRLGHYNNVNKILSQFVKDRNPYMSAREFIGQLKVNMQELFNSWQSEFNRAYQDTDHVLKSQDAMGKWHEEFDSLMFQLGLLIKKQKRGR
jgi:hypothetical protein